MNHFEYIFRYATTTKIMIFPSFIHSDDIKFEMILNMEQLL